MWNLHVLHVCAWVLSGYYAFVPQFKNTHETNWELYLVSLPSPYDNWDRLPQTPATLNAEGKGYRRWMEFRFLPFLPFIIAGQSFLAFFANHFRCPCWQTIECKFLAHPHLLNGQWKWPRDI